MKLHSINIKGWRSFDPEVGIFLTNLGQANLIIGPNNVGKSNVVRFVKWLRDSLVVNVQWPNNRNASSTWNLLCVLSQHDCWLGKTSTVEATLEIDWGDAANDLPKEIVWPGNLIKAHVRATRSGGQSGLFLTPIMNDGTPMLRFEDGNLVVWSQSGTYGPTNTEFDAGPFVHVARSICQFLAHDVRDVEALRHHELAKGSSNHYAQKHHGNGARLNGYTSDGGDMLRKLHSLSTDVTTDAQWTELRADIEEWLRILLNDPTLASLESLQDDVRLTFHRDIKFACRLEALGTGVAEVLMLLVFLRLHRDDPRLVLIEEPEAHLHPAAALELIRIVRRDMPKHQLLITTHSTSLIDGIEYDWRVFRAGRQMRGATTFTALETSREKLGLLEDLGLHPSQLFLANVVIWVEGPSDVIYLRRLLKEVDDKHQLLEGRSHSFVFYGGASLSHVGFDDEGADDDERTSRLVRCLQVGSRNVIVCDADYASEDGRLKRRVERLSDEARELSGNCVHITPAREIEDCVRHDVLLRAVVASIGHVLIGGKLRSVTLDAVDVLETPGERFQNALARRARFEPDIEDGGREAAVKRLVNHIARKKVAIAAQVAASGDGSPFTVEGGKWGQGLLADIA